MVGVADMPVVTMALVTMTLVTMAVSGLIDVGVTVIVSAGLGALVRVSRGRPRRGRMLVLCVHVSEGIPPRGTLARATATRYGYRSD